MIDPYTRQERGPSPAAVLLEQHRHRLTAARRRSGLAQTQLLILGAVIAAIIVLSVGGFAVYRSVTRGAEDNATKAANTAGRTSATCVVPGAGVAASTYDIAVGNAGGATAMSAWQHANVLLGSTRGVFIGTAHVLSTVPDAGTDKTKEALIVGAIAPNGSTFCAVKVFDANDRSLIGNYRYAKQSGAGGNPEIPDACVNAGTGAPPTITPDSGWPPAS